MQTLVGKFTQCSETFDWQWSSSKFSNFCSWVCRKNSTHSLYSKCNVWLQVQRMSRSLFSRLSFAFVVDSVHAFKLWFSVRKKRSMASPIWMVNLNRDWFFKLVKNSSLECVCYFCHLAAWTSDSQGWPQSFSLCCIIWADQLSFCGFLMLNFWKSHPCLYFLPKRSSIG